MATASRKPAPDPGSCSAGAILFRRFPEETGGSPSFPEDPVAALPCSSTPGGLPRQTIAALRCCPRYHKHEDSPVHLSFEALSHGFAVRCLRLKASFLSRQPRLASGGGSDLSGRDGPRRVLIEAFRCSFLHLSFRFFVPGSSTIPASQGFGWRHVIKSG